MLFLCHVLRSVAIGSPDPVLTVWQVAVVACTRRTAWSGWAARHLIATLPPAAVAPSSWTPRVPRRSVDQLSLSKAAHGGRP
jgi:hypothetical protein